MDEINQLKKENDFLRTRIADLENELKLLKTHRVIQQGMKGETLVKNLTNGNLTAANESFDLRVGEKIKIEVKYSSLYTPVRDGKTRRWSWKSPLGLGGKKAYDFLILIGEKDNRFPEQYPDNTPYVYFLVPRQDVDQLGSGLIN